MPCPDCYSYNTIKNGKAPNGLQRYKCKDCGRSYTSESELYSEKISQKAKLLLKSKLLLLKIKLMVIKVKLLLNLSLYKKLIVERLT